MKPKIVINHWEETCEDDSCYEYGTSILVNGKEPCQGSVDHDGCSVGS